MKRTKIVFLTLAVALLSAGLVYAGGSKDSGASASGVQKVRVAHTQTYVPYDFINDKGESDGFEVAVLKAVDELIPDYEFEFVGTTDDDLLIGIESGKYGLGTKGAWITEERKKKYLIPQRNVAASIIGIVYRRENVDQIKDMESFAAFSGKLVPIAPQSAQYSVVEDYNATHQDNQVKLVPSEAFTITDAYTWVVEGRYDAFFDIKLSFQTTVADEKGAWHRYADRLTYTPYKAIPTYALFNKKHQDLADMFDKAIEQLTADGTISKLSNQYFGEDIFQYL
jgi:L-cystine transport system substrate-binding protein